MSDLEAAIERLDEFYRRGVSGYSPDDIERDSQIGDDVLTVLSAARQSVPVTVEEVSEAARVAVHAKHPEWHDRGVGIVQGSHYRSGFEDGAKWIADTFTITRKPTETEEER